MGPLLLSAIALAWTLANCNYTTVCVWEQMHDYSPYDVFFYLKRAKKLRKTAVMGLSEGCCSVPFRVCLYYDPCMTETVEETDGANKVHRILLREHDTSFRYWVHFSSFYHRLNVPSKYSVHFMEHPILSNILVINVLLTGETRPLPEGTESIFLAFVNTDTSLCPVIGGGASWFKRWILVYFLVLAFGISAVACFAARTYCKTGRGDSKSVEKQTILTHLIHEDNM